MKRARHVMAAAALLALAAPAAQAHKPGDTVLDLRAGAGQVTGRWEIALADLDHAVDLDADGSGTVTGAELAARSQGIVDYAMAHLALPGCATQASLAGIARREGGVYAVLALQATCRGAAALELRYDLFFDFDAQHRGLWRWDGPAGPARGLFRRDDRTVRLPLSRPLGLAAQLRAGRPGAVLPAAGLVLALALLAGQMAIARRRRMRSSMGGWVDSSPSKRVRPDSGAMM